MSTIISEIKKKLFHGFYAKLNEKQREAVLAPDGPVLVVAGAGSGKTTVLIQRISYLVRFGNAYHADVKVSTSESELILLQDIANNCKLYSPETVIPILKMFSHAPCPPDRILAITFTNKAAEEIKNRLAVELGQEASQIWAGTFHSICVRILRRFAQYTQYSNNFLIYDQDDAKKIIANILKDREIEDPELTPKYILNVISKAKNMLVSPEEFREKNQGSEKRKLCAEIYEEYQKTLLSFGAMDFDDIIIESVKLLQSSTEVLSWCQNKFKYILVDEYQDTNRVQYMLMKLISQKHNNVMVVGDDDQSIYKFRGAAVENILNFDKQFENTKVIFLEQNYRSTRSIIDAANGLIAHNNNRRGKTLWSHNNIGRQVEVIQLENQEKEAEYITNLIQKLVYQKKYRFYDFAVLYRTKAQSRVLEDIFTKSGIPHRLLSGVRFYDHTEVKDILAYLRLIHNPQDVISLTRIINVPRRGIGNTTIEKLRTIAAEEGISLFDVIQNCQNYEEVKKSYSKLSEFAALIKELKEIAEHHSPSTLIHNIISKTNYMETLIGDENEERRKNVEELLSSAVRHEEHYEDATLSSFLEEIALVSDVDNYDETSNSVTLMTVHAAKGLEFSFVFLAGMEENLFPSPQSSATLSDLEEERRLAYVAMTRAREELVITCCHHRMIYGRTNANDMSRFIREIPEEHVVIKPFLYKNEGSTGTYQKKNAFQQNIYSVSTFDRWEGAIHGSKLNRATTSKVQTPKQPQRVFAVGDRVLHGLFGAGTVLEAKKFGADTMYRIRFDHTGEKKLMATYAKLKPEQ